jgi:DHA1 family inner membrane transport protein
MVAFTTCNFFVAVASSYSTLLLLHTVTAIAHGVIFGVGAACASSPVAKSKASSVVAGLTGGLTVLMVIRVPFGSWIGQLFSWRMPYLIAAVMGTVTILGLTWLLPRKISYEPAAQIVAQPSLLGNRYLATMFPLMAIGFGGIFVIFTFLSPLPTDVAGMQKETVNVALPLSGGAAVVGSLAGGMLNPAPCAGEGSDHGQASAPDTLATASGLNIAVSNLWISSGSFVGGQLLKGTGLLTTPCTSIAMVVIVLLIAGIALGPQSAIGNLNVALV